MTPRLRRAALTAHVTCSVAWLGSVAAFLALALTGLTSADPQVVRAAYVAADLVTRLVIVPLGLAALATGVVQSLGTPWGLFRHYWVIAKLLLTALAVVLLLVHTQPIGELAGRAAEAALSPGDHRGLRIQLVVDAGAALVVLLVNTMLGMYKPRGMTAYGRRRQRDGLELDGGEPARGTSRATPRWVYASGLLALVLAVLVVLMHLSGHGLGGH